MSMGCVSYEFLEISLLGIEKAIIFPQGKIS